MRKFLTSIIVFTVFALAAGAQTPPATDAEQNELDRLNQEVVELYKLGKYDDALAAARKTLPLSIKLNGEESRSVAVMYFNIGAIYNAKKQHSEALESFGKTLAIYRNKFPGDKARIFEASKEIAVTHYKRLDNKEAARWFTDALKLSEELYGEENKNTIFCLGYLGMIYQNLNDDVQAEPYFWRAKEAAEKVFGEESPESERYDDAYDCFTGTTPSGKVKELMEARRTSEKDDTKTVDRSDFVINGQAKSLAKPVYPRNAYSIGGMVTVKVTIDENGNVTKARAFCGPSVFWKVTEEAAMKSKFSQTIFNGAAVKVTGIIVYKFNLRPKN